MVKDDARVYDKARVFGSAKIEEDALIFGNANIYGNAVIRDGSRVMDNAYIYGDALVMGHTEVKDNARILGDAVVYGVAEIFGNSIVRTTLDYLVITKPWSHHGHITYTHTNKMWTDEGVHCNGKQLIERVYKRKGELAGKCTEATVKYVRKIYRLMDQNNKKQ